MPRLIWSAPGTRFFEQGLDRGVLYVGGADGVPWNGITSVSESPTGGEPRAYYIDGIKYLNIASSEEFEATLNAYQAPYEFGPCDGTTEIHNGLFVTQQARKAFGLSYRTRVGNDIDGADHGYKIHLVYNALAAPTERESESISDELEAAELSWHITTLPPSLSGYKPTAHFVIDSRKTPRGLLKAIEDILYGSDEAQPRLPMVSELVDMFKSQGPVTRRNLALNPSFRATSGTVEVRRNLADRPVSAPSSNSEIAPGTIAWAYNWFGASEATGRLEVVFDASDGPVGTRAYMRKVWTSTSGSGDTGFRNTLPQAKNAYPVTPGDTLTISAYMRSSAPMKRGRSRIFWHDSTGAALTPSSDQSSWVYLNTDWQRISLTTKVPAGAAYAMIWAADAWPADNSPWQPDDTLDAGALLVEKSSVALPYFDGDTPAADGLTYSWTGTAGASESVAIGQRIARWGASLALSPYQVPVNGGFSARIHGTVSYTDMLPGGEIGKYYSARVSLTAQDDQPAYVRTAIHDGNIFISGETDYEKIPAGTTVVWDVVSKTPATKAQPHLYIYPSTASGYDTPLCNWTQVEEVSGPDIPVSSEPPYFDGDTENTFGNTYSWEGAPDASPSVLNSWN